MYCRWRTRLGTKDRLKYNTHTAFKTLQSSVIYQATVKRHNTNTSETYIGLTANEFKTRYRNHIASFRHAKHRNSTELGKHIWTLKDSNIDHSISWCIISSRSSYNSSSKRCNLCLREKCLIIYRLDLSSLKVIPLKLFYYQTFLKLGVINIHDMNIKKMQ